MVVSGSVEQRSRRPTSKWICQGARAHRNGLLSRACIILFALFAALGGPDVAAKQERGVLSARPSASVGMPALSGLHRLRAGTTATLYVPDTVPAGTPAPFLLLLHGADRRGDDIIRRFKAQADRRGIILLAPDSADRSWDVAMSISGRGVASPRFGRDVRRIDAVLKEAFARVNVDAQQVAVAGFSDGASTALSLGARNTALFPATLAFSAGGMVPGWSGPPGRVFFAHGANDSILPIAIARDTLAPALGATGFTGTFVTFEGGHELPEPVLEQAMAWWLERPAAAP